MEDFDQDDASLAKLFAEAAEPLADDGFSRAVVGRIRRRQTVRQVALGLAGVLGLVLAVAFWDGGALWALVQSIPTWSPQWSAFGLQLPWVLMLAAVGLVGAMTALFTE